MGWFGGGSSSSDDVSGPKDFSSSDESAFSAPIPSQATAPAMGGASSLQQYAAQIQQKVS